MLSHCNSISTMFHQQNNEQSNQELSLQQSNHHILGLPRYSQQSGPTIPLTNNISADNNPQQHWYTYPPSQVHAGPSSHPHYHPHHPHHHQTPPPPLASTPSNQQYLSPPDPVIPWPSHSAHHCSPPVHIQYQHHQSPTGTYQYHQLHHSHMNSALTSEWNSSSTLDDANNNPGVINTSEPSPPISISSNELSSPRTPSPSSSNNNNNSLNNNNLSKNGDNQSNISSTLKPTQMRHPYDWINKRSYQSQPHPGKTRTKDKYRVVYTDHQRLELEKEFHYSRYITIRRKAELAANLALSERQVKIWFQNRRAKERKQVKKREELEQKSEIKTEPANDVMASNLSTLNNMNGMLASRIIHSANNAISAATSSSSSPPGLNRTIHPTSTTSLLHPAAAYPHQQHRHTHTILGL